MLTVLLPARCQKPDNFYLWNFACLVGLNHICRELFTTHYVVTLFTLQMKALKQTKKTKK